MPPEFSIRSDSVDVDQIMTQIRARIREKRGVDYTEEELRQLASVKLEKFLDPTKVRSDLIAHYRRLREPGAGATAPPENYAFDDHLVYGSARGASGGIITRVRRLLNPVLKLFFNPNPIIQVLNRQSAINAYNREEFDRTAALNYELIHNLVLEVTRLSIEVKNLKMRMESLSGRLDFSDRRARALESVVQYRPGTGPAAELAEAASAPVSTGGRAPRRDSDAPRRDSDAPRREGEAGAPGGPIKGEAQRARRRRRRRGRGGAPGQPEPGSGSGGDEPGAQADAAGRWRRHARGEWRRRRQPALRRRRARSRERTRARHGRFDGPVKLAVVVQRYGLDINGGAELHARYVAEQLARRADVDVLTTCARDYITWRNELPAGESEVNGLRVRRFPVRRERDPERFGRRSHHVFESAHSIADELAWLDSEGPFAAALIDCIRRNEAGYDFFIFFSFRYYHAYYGIRAAPTRALLVPTAERDGAVGLSIFAPIFRGVRALMYNSFEERAMIQAVSGNDAVPHVVVGVGSEVPARTDPGAVPPEVRDHVAVHRLRRPHRREQGLQGAVLPLRAIHARRPERPVARADGTLDPAHPGSPAHPASRLRRRRGQVRRHRRLGGPRDAVATSRACRWWRSRPGRSASRCWRTAAATCCRASA